MPAEDNNITENEDKFIKVYSDIPVSLRREVILVIEDKPLTWNAAYVEVKNRTKLGERILKKLIELEFI
jgi:hypothetical protein